MAVAVRAAAPTISLHLPSGEILYIGIDASKYFHHIALISRTLLLQKGRRFKDCPVFKISNSRSGFEELKSILERYALLSQCEVLFETTGHYHRPLKQFLQEEGVQVYEIHVTKQPKDKSDEKDARRLGNTLYNQRELGALPGDDEQLVRLATPKPLLARRLGNLPRLHKNISKDITRRENQLWAIVDQLCPEFSAIFKDPNGMTALRIRKAYPTASAIASTDPLTLWRCGGAKRGRPGRPGMLRLHSLVQRSIALKDPATVEALCFEQEHLIDELLLLRKHRDEVESRIAEIIKDSREAKILMSTGIIGVVEAATLIAGIGDIMRFETASQLKKYLGWAPGKLQTGKSKDSEKLIKSGNRLLRDTMYIVAWHAVQRDTEWRKGYRRLLPIKCQWNPRIKDYEGKNKVIGRIIGQVVSLIFLLLKHDALLQRRHDGGELPEPQLYDREIHSRGRA